VMENLQRDYARFGVSRGERLRELLFNTGSWAVVSYRLRRALHQCRGPRILRLMLNACGMAIKVITEVLTHIEIPASVEIGPGLSIPHTGYIIIHSRAKLGANCTLTTGVVIGHGGGSKSGTLGCPTIGDRVYLGPGATLIGPITIGDDALIAPGAIVTRSVPPRGVVGGNPAKLISLRGSFDLIEYPGMLADASRSRSLAEAENQRKRLTDLPQSLDLVGADT
jgi:serine O-acetyltransferase